MLESFLKLIDKTLALITEVQERRERFFSEIVEPINDGFIQFCENHMRTFEHVRDSLKNQVPFSEIFRELKSRIIQEMDNWLIFQKLNALGRQPKARLGEYFKDYCKAIKECVRDAGKTQGRGYQSVAFYSKVSDNLKHSMTRDVASGKMNDQEIRKHMLEVLDTVIVDFQHFRTEVRMKYLVLKQHCQT